MFMILFFHAWKDVYMYITSDIPHGEISSKKILFIPVVKDFIYICHGVLWYCLNYINNSKLVENPDSS